MSSCLEIVQEIEIEKDGSGSMMFMIDYSSLNGITNLTGNSDAQRQINSESRKLARELAGMLKGQEGISEVRTDFSRSEGRNSISFCFRDADAFNKAIYAIAGATREGPAVLKINSKRIKVRNLTPYMSLLLDEQAKNQFDIFGNLVNVHEIYKLPGKIKRASNRAQKILKEKGYVHRYYNLGDVLDGKKNTGIKIRYQMQ